jgi:hypothetical protein
MRSEAAVASAAGRGRGAGCGGGDVGLAVQAQQADGQAAQRRHHARRVSRPDQRFVLLVGHVAHPVKAVFYLPVAAGPGGLLKRRPGSPLDCTYIRAIKVPAKPDPGKHSPGRAESNRWRGFWAALRGDRLGWRDPGLPGMS